VNSIGAKGLGEIALIGFSAAVANAVYNATGKRLRDLPITPEKINLKKA
jgi:xanthine dehydrogenase YagR molybdenum-binding subunit